MNYKVSEIFYSIQGEGFWTGTPMIFIRMYGCNLKCSFCDTKYAREGDNFALMTTDEIIAKCRELSSKVERICITGGEPLLQDLSRLLGALHGSGYHSHIETNGTIFDAGIILGDNWITASPKGHIESLKILPINELKLLYDGQDLSGWEGLSCYKVLQPIYGKTEQQTIETVLNNPEWKMSFQCQKYAKLR